MKKCLGSMTLLAAIIFAAGATAAETAKKTRWKITGQLEEACTCNAACPCWFNSLPSKMNCGGGQVLFIQKGHYGKVKLDGLAVGNFGQSPDGKTMMCSFGEWNFSYLYIDERANDKQRVALKDIGMKVLPVAASKNVECDEVVVACVGWAGRRGARVAGSGVTCSSERSARSK